jgi:type III secretory pathway component EscS
MRELIRPSSVSAPSANSEGTLTSFSMNMKEIILLVSIGVVMMGSLVDTLVSLILE